MKYVLSVFILLLAALPARAHPHAWIDLKSSLAFNVDGMLIAVTQEWIFDEYYTTFVLEDFKPANGESEQDVLNKLARTNLSNLRDYGYFSELASGKTKARFGEPVDISTRIDTRRMVMRFTLPLRQPLDPKQAPIEYRVFDPSYFTEMLHHKQEHVIVSHMPEGCQIQLKKPNPTIAHVSLAQSLDRFAQAPSNLGSLFAETITVRCP